jgi:hypothetical protein
MAMLPVSRLAPRNLLQREHRESYDWAVARAVANMPVLASNTASGQRRRALASGSSGPHEPTALNAPSSLAALRQIIPV